jgi:flagellin
MSVINTNLQAMQIAAMLGRNQDLLNGSINQLSSGSRITNPAVDPVGVAISDKLTAQNQRLDAASTNIQNALSYAQTNDSMLGTVGNVLSRLSQLATLAQDPTTSNSDVADYQKEFQTLQGELRRIIGGTTAEIGGTTDIASPEGAFNGAALYGPSATGYQVALGDSAAQSMVIPATNLRTGAMLNLIQQDSSGAYALSVSTATTTDLSAAMQQVGDARTALGAAQERLDLASTAIQTQGVNMQSAISQINDVDVAAGSTALAKYNVLVQADAAILAQANTTSEAVLKLLKE